MTAGGALRPTILHVAAVEYTAIKLLLPQLEELERRGYAARIACAPDSAAFDERLQPFGPLPLHFPRSPRPFAVARATLALGRMVRRLRPAVVHLHTPAAALPARLLPRFWVPSGTKVVYTVHGFAHVWDDPGPRDRVLEGLERRLAPRTDLLLFQSQEDLDRTRDRGYRTRLRYLGNGVEPGWFDVKPKGRPSRPLELLYVGRLIREKGLLDLFDALAQVPDARLTLAGSQLPTDRDGVEAELRARAESVLAGRVRFLGMIEKAELRRVVAESDFLALASYREGVPRSLIEGFATGTPAIATDVRGCRELVEDGVTGFLVPAHDPLSLAQAIRRAGALEDAEYRALSGRAATLASERYRESSVFDRLCAAYEELGVDPASLSPAVVAHDVGRSERGSVTAPPEEEHGARGVAGVAVVGEPVENAHPEEEQPDQPADQPRPADRASGVVDAPEQLGARPGDHAGVDLVEVPEEVAVPAQGEPGEVVGAGVDVLEERRLGVHETARSEDAMDLGNHDLGRDDVLEDRLDDDRGHRPVGERDGMSVGDEGVHLAPEQVQPDHLDLGAESVQHVGTVPDRATTDDEHGSSTVGQQRQQSGQLGLGDTVPRLGDAP